MVFSSPLFLFLFLPLVLGCYFSIPVKSRNYLILFTSYLFYIFGETKYWWLILLSILINYLFSIAITITKNKYFILAIGITVNLAILVWFKYANFIDHNLSELFNFLDVKYVPMQHPIHLPLGISFFTFHAISYLIDIKRGNAVVQKRLTDFALYILLFPQLIAGPIIRYKDIANQLTVRVSTGDDFAIGFQRFVIGLGKKVLLANPLGDIADSIFSLTTSTRSASVAWLGIVSYTFQIYFDFSGYSDMAIGLMRILGFRIMENFDYPYVSRSVREFWRRWHISLSSWFRDYVYIPMGGNRCGEIRTQINLLVVFILCGLWHGASWSFLIWGLWHGVFLLLERTKLGDNLARLPRLLQHGYAMFVVVIGWVFFRADNLSLAVGYIKTLFGLGLAVRANIYPLPRFFDNFTALVITLAIIGSTPFGRNLWGSHDLMADSSSIVKLTWSSIQPILMLVILLLSSGFVAAGTYNPFIYFRF